MACPDAELARANLMAKWAKRAALMPCLAVLVGCRSSPPDLAPSKTAERLVAPSAGQYLTPGFPPEALNRTNEKDFGPAPRPFTPAGGFGSPSNGGMGPYKF